MPLRRRFVLVFIAFSVLLTAAGGWLSWSVTQSALQSELDQKLIWVAGAAAEVGTLESLVLALGPGDERAPLYRAAQQRLLGLSRYVSAAYVFRDDNTVVVSTAPADSLPIGATLHFLAPFTSELALAWSSGESTTPLFDVDGRPYKYGFVRLGESPLMIGVLIQAGYDAALDRFRRTMILGSIAAAFLAALLAAFLATNVVRPLDRLVRSAMLIQRGRMDIPVQPEGGDELGRLSRAMERMRRGIGERDQQLRLMLAQVAHEIRNPLGGMELFTTVAADTEDPEERRRLLGRVRDEIAALSGIINDFLTFARPTPADRHPHDVRDPVREAAEIVEAEVSGDGRSIRVELADEAIPVIADAAQVKRIVLNLLRNGAQAGTNVTVSAHKTNEGAVISVSDDGPGVAPELRDRLFEPFVSDKEQGAGLGLAIVQRVAEANGARVELVDPGDSDAAGTEFRVYFGEPVVFSGTDEPEP